MPRVTVGLALAACMAAGCGQSEEPPGRVRISEPAESDRSGHATVPAREGSESAIAESPSPIVEVDETNFDNLVLMSPRPVLVSFQPAWSEFSKSLQPTIEDLARDFEGRATIVRVADPQLIARFQVRSFPTVLVFVNGRVVEESLGVRPKEELAELLAAQLSPPLERTASIAPDPLAAPPMPTADTNAPGVLPGGK